MHMQQLLQNMQKKKCKHDCHFIRNRQSFCKIKIRNFERMRVSVHHINELFQSMQSFEDKKYLSLYYKYHIS